jgi:hypothetical protein
MRTSERWIGVKTKRPVRTKSGGKPTFPTLEINFLNSVIEIESLSSKVQIVVANASQVGKVGLPPLLLPHSLC